MIVRRYGPKIAGAWKYVGSTYVDDVTPELTDAEIEELLTADAIEVDWGAELLTSSDLFNEDISADVLGGEVEHNNYATIHGTCRLMLTRELTWSTARVKPYITLTGAGHTKTWYLGVYLLTTPETQLEVSPSIYTVSGYDKLILLNRPVGDTYVVDNGTGYLAAVRQAITDSGATGVSVQLDGTSESTTLTNDMVWILDPGHESTWLEVCNDLLAAVNYRGLWADATGVYRSEPYISPSGRGSTWSFDLTDSTTQIVGEQRRLTTDEWDATNWWRFVQNGLTTAASEGAGFYTVDNSGSDPEVRKVIFLDVESQTELESRAAAIVEAAAQREKTLDITTGPLPILGHWDVVDYWDPEANMGQVRAQIASWRQYLDGTDTHVSMEVL